MAEINGTYADAFAERWKEFFEQAHNSNEIDAQGYMMISMAIAYLSDELADLKMLLLEKH